MQPERIWILIARKLSNEASSEELRELDQLLRKNPDQHFNLEVFDKLWQKQDEYSDTDVEQAYEQHLQRMSRKGIHLNPPTEEITYTYPVTKRFNRPANWLIAASILGVILLGIWWGVQQKPANVSSPEIAMNEITTPIGSKSKLLLPDSTVVWLNAGSKLTYPKEFGKNAREVTLVGEAFFDVKKKGKIPFIIHTHRMDIKVLGTTFNVKSYPGEATTEASLIKGSIEVLLKDRDKNPILLKPNDKIIVREFDGATTTSKPSSSVENAQSIPAPEVAIHSIAYDQNYNTVLESAWVEDLLVFTEMSFSEVVKLMERWYGIRIQIENPKLLNQKLTGSFRNESVLQALEALQYVIDFDFERTSSKLITIK